MFTVNVFLDSFFVCLFDVAVCFYFCLKLKHAYSIYVIVCTHFRNKLSSSCILKIFFLEVKPTCP